MNLRQRRMNSVSMSLRSALRIIKENGIRLVNEDSRGYLWYFLNTDGMTESESERAKRLIEVIAEEELTDLVSREDGYLCAVHKVDIEIVHHLAFNTDRSMLHKMRIFTDPDLEDEITKQILL